MKKKAYISPRMTVIEVDLDADSMFGPASGDTDVETPIPEEDDEYTGPGIGGIGDGTDT